MYLVSPNRAESSLSDYWRQDFNLIRLKTQITNSVAQTIKRSPRKCTYKPDMEAGVRSHDLETTKGGLTTSPRRIIYIVDGCVRLGLTGSRLQFDTSRK